MVRIDELAEAALNGDGLTVRSLVQDLFRQNIRLTDIPKPLTEDPRVLAVGASLIELLAGRLNQEAPAWTAGIGAVQEPVFLVRSAATMPRLRALCQAESPEPLRKRRLYAPPNYLELA